MEVPSAPRSGPIAALEAKLRRHPDVRFTVLRAGIVIDAPNPGGFSISLLLDGLGWVVSLGDGGMHEHFDGGDDAVEFVGFCLSDRCRLRQTSWLGVFKRAVVEARESGGWRMVYETGRLGLPSWRWRHEGVFQNLLIRTESPT